MSTSGPHQGARPHLKLTQKIVAGYLSVALFSLAALFLALIALKHQESSSRDLIEREFRAVDLVRELRANLLAQERLERQFLILREPDLLDLRQARFEAFHADWQQLSTLGIEEQSTLQSLVEPLAGHEQQILTLLQAKNTHLPEEFLSTTLAPLRATLSEQLEQTDQNLSARINLTLQRQYSESAHAFRLTLTLLLAGMIIGGAIAVRVVCSIRNSMRRLTDAVRQTAEERFDHSLEDMGDDEFGRLAKEFVNMGIKLRDLQRRYLDANPLTHLPGNLAIERELERRIASGEPFAHAYIDLDNFKAYGDRYGYQKGSDVIAITGQIIREAVTLNGNQGDLVGHIGGDDYLVLTTPERAELLARTIITRFDEQKQTFYTADDFAAGSYTGIDRFGEERIFPLMSMSIAIICSDNYQQPTHHLISEESAKMKEHLKHLPGSNYLFDRRKR